MTTPYRVTAQFWDHATLWSDDERDAGHSTDGGRVFGITRTRYVECDRYGCQPVAVIDTEDREQVERLAKAAHGVEFAAAWDEMHGGLRAERVDVLQAALREFADPKPPCGACLSVTYSDGKGREQECREPRGHDGPHAAEDFRWTAHYGEAAS